MFKVSNLTVSHENKLIINNLSLDLAKSSTNVLMGPNGCGKSTLAYTLMGHPNYNIECGSVLLNNDEILSQPTEKRARAGLFLASQYPPDIPGVQVFTYLKEAHKMLTNSEISVNEFKKLAQEAFQKVQLSESFLFRNLNDGFSGGEKKRFEIAQLLLFKPKIAILDEIDSGLDVDGIKIISDAINIASQENPNLIFLIITHYNRILENINVDKVLIMKNGQIIKQGARALAESINSQGYFIASDKDQSGLFL